MVNKIDFKFREIRTFKYELFCYYVRIVPKICWDYQPDVFLLSKKLGKKILISFYVNNKIKCQNAPEIFSVAFGESVMGNKML